MSTTNIQPTKKVTSTDVARFAGVSQATVSRAMNPDSKLSAELRQRVLEAAETLGYTPNILARSLTGAKTRIIGLVIIESTSYYMQVITGIAQELQNLGYQTLLFMARNNGDYDTIFTRISEYRIDGLIITGVQANSTLVQECHRRNITSVLFGRSIEGNLVSSISCDNYSAGQDVARYFLEKGCQQTACIHADPRASTSYDRMKGFSDYISNHGERMCMTVQSGWSYDQGHQATLDLFKHQIKPDAIFCINIDVAMGCMDALRHHLHLRVPQDVMVVGFDDVPLAHSDSFSVTTVSQPSKQMITHAIQILLEEINNPSQPIQTIALAGSMIMRASTEESL